MILRPFNRASSCVIIMPFVIVGIISVIVLLSFFPNGLPEAYGHAFTIRSDPSPSQSAPTPPTKVDVYFSEPIDLRYSTIKVIDAGGKQVDNKDEHYIGGDPSSLSVTLPSSGLKDGVYTVSTKVLSSTDGHVVDSAFVFGIGQAALPSTEHSNAQFGSQSQLYIPNAIARFPAYVGQVLVVGAAFATLWLWKPISQVRWLNDAIAPVRKRIDKRLIILMIIGSAILVISDFGIIYVQANDIGTGINEAIGTKFGSVWVMRTVESFIVLAVSLEIYVRRIRGRVKSASSISLSKGEVASLFVIGLAILATTTLIGHGATNGQLLPIATDFIHNLAASLWIGGIIYLAFIVAPKIKSAETLEESVKASTLSIIIPRFSTIPVTILGVIVVTGPFLLYFIENNLDLTLASLYGKWLIIKLSLAAIMIAIGGYNQRIIQRDVVRISTATSIAAAPTTVKNARGASQGGEQLELDPDNNNNNINIDKKDKNHRPKKDKKTDAISKFSRTTKVEAIVGIALLAAVALLVNTGTPGSEFQGQQQQQSNVSSNSTIGTTVSQQQHFKSTRFVEDGNRVILSIDPFTPGTNNFNLSFLDSKGNPLDIKSAQIRYTQIEKGIGPINVNTTQISRGAFSANAAFGLPGQWNLEVEGIQTKSNALNIVASYDLFIKPRLDQLNFNIQEYKIPQNNSQPLYPLFDESRNAIWVGDTAIDSGRIWEYNLTSGKYMEHKVAGVSIVTVMALESHNHLWFVDPIMKNLGQYDPSTGTSRLFKLPIQGAASGITVNANDNNVWITAPVDNKVIRFNPQTNSFTPFILPTGNAQPFGIIADKMSEQIWIAEGIGKLANIDPQNKYKITEYAPSTDNNSTLKSPTALFADPLTGNIYISQHEGHTVSVFNPLLKTFKDFLALNANGLPFGMAMDSNYHNLWVAEHTINKIAAIDPQTGTSRELTIPNQTPIVQWITADNKGNIWLAEQRGNSLAVITATPKLGQSSNPTNPATSEADQVNKSKNNRLFGLPPLGLSYAAVVGPSVAIGITISAIFYTKSIIDLKQSIMLAHDRHKNAKKYK